MKNWLQNDKMIFLLSVAIAVVMWWSISYNTLPFTKEEEYSIKMQDVKVKAMYNEDKYELRQKTDKVDLTLMGNKYIIDNMPEASYRVFVNLRGLGPGKHRNVPIQVEGLPINVRKRISPSTLDIELEKKIQKEVPVHIDVIGKPADDFQAKPAVVKPDKVIITGTESKLKNVILAKAGININGATESINKSVELEVIGETGPIGGVYVSPETVDVTIPIEPLSKKVPLSIDIEKGPPRGYKVGKVKMHQESILVYGPRSILDQLLIYKGNKLDLSRVTSTTTFDMPIKLQNNVSKIEPEKITVTVEVIPIG